MKKSIRFRWSIYPGIGWSLCSGFDGHFRPESGGQFDRFFQLRSKKGKEIYKKRKQTVEPVFGIIKEVLGFRRFSLRGEFETDCEWSLVCLGYNLKRLFKLSMA